MEGFDRYGFNISSVVMETAHPVSSSVVNHLPVRTTNVPVDATEVGF